MSSNDKKRRFSFSSYHFKRKAVLYIILTAIALLTVIPFIWTLSTALKGPNEAVFSMPPNFIPKDFTLDNFIEVWQTLPIPLYFWNSLIITFWGMILPILLATLAGFPLARMNFKGKNIIFIIIIATMMVPAEATMIPIYLILNKIGLLGTFTGVVLPIAVNAFGIFLMRQAFLNIPREIEESAIIDGANVFQIWWKILLPMVKPMIATLGILSFIGAWNSFLWPLIVLRDESMHPLTLGLYKLDGAFEASTRAVATGSIIALVPVIIIFLLLQRHFINSATSGSIKG
ncbi:carbohydrate ABC transporter permease [Pseudogracilibacillus auburnensis]|uniref:Carbohydrate ABC transporter membrane protein 2 (CUT1 family) n=1 Tax=Pseudogracilibacillus auburnensis TaxID=1494959 RepID=A0A2V3VUG0_9BACI|nr:carbohydrate ABC transporter permease [Pseudogracilibacillus auburnensis]MBO1004666.1 carbohydrate ABC transporter permease [Pseudogracilibacillus auburnensis]PXW85573.1 carbohydrate ABC transporter membrane protein 2 (CUT1 family) [Pseudogracilibacillus auburnensis]